MKSDIQERKVEGIAMAMVPRNNDINDEMWDVYILNLKDQSIQSVLVSSKGYGKVDGSDRVTATFRHFYDGMAPQTTIKVEAVIKTVSQLTNEFWVSFSQENYLYDKKYIFVQGVQDETLFTDIPLIDRRGIMIK